MTDAELIKKLKAMAEIIFRLDNGSGDAQVMKLAAERLEQINSGWALPWENGDNEPAR